MDQREAMAALDKAITKLELQAESDEDMALALEVVQAERAEADFDGEFGGVNAEPKEPVRKEIVAAGSGGLALVIAWLAQQAGMTMDAEVAGAFALIVAAVAGYLKDESFRLPGA